jgi:phosphoribosylformylglycinamidine synthase
VRHGEGKLVTRTGILDRLENAHLAPLRYIDSQGRPAGDYPANPNGSPGAIAALCDPTGRLFGLMPHPEGYLDGTQHPAWTRQVGAAMAEGSGLSLFRNAVAAVREGRLATV